VIKFSSEEREPFGMERQTEVSYEKGSVFTAFAIARGVRGTESSERTLEDGPLYVKAKEMPLRTSAGLREKIRERREAFTQQFFTVGGGENIKGKGYSFGKGGFPTTYL